MHNAQGATKKASATTTTRCGSTGRRTAAMTGQKRRLLIAILIIEALTIARHEIDNQNKPERKRDSVISPQRQNNEVGMLCGDLSF